MKKFLLLTVTALLPVVTYAEEATKQASQKGGSSFFSEYILPVLLLMGALFVIGHMLYELFRPNDFSQEDFTVEGFVEKRQQEGRPAESSPQELEKCEELINDAWNCWTNIEVDEENEVEYRKPKKMKEIFRSKALLKQIVEIAPTDPEVVDGLNEYKEVVRTNEKRSFDGSWKLVFLGLAFAVVMALIMKGDSGFFMAFLTYGAFFWVSVLIYYLSSLTPQFLIEKRAKRGGGNISSGLVALAFGVMASGQTVRYKYSDGTTEDDHSGHMVALMLGIFVAIVVAFTIAFWAVLNYLRNYVLYF